MREQIDSSPSSNYRRSFSDAASSSEPLDHTTRYRFRNPIPEPIIDPPPTTSGIGASINVITSCTFQIDWDFIKADYYSTQNTTLRTWFEQMSSPLLESIKREWIADIERLRTNIPFFLWFPTFASKHGLQQVYQLPSLNVQTSLLKVWHFQNGSSVSSVHPHADDLKLLLKGDTILATPFRKGREGNELVKLDDLKKVHKVRAHLGELFRPI